MDGKAPPPKSKVFKNKWLLECAVEVTARDINSCEPISAVCMFCKIFGKEEPEDAATRKRKRSNFVQVFKRPWRTDKMKQHHNKMHPKRWAEYSLLVDAKRNSYFIDNLPATSDSSFTSLATTSSSSRKRKTIDDTEAQMRIQLEQKKLANEHELVLQKLQFEMEKSRREDERQRQRAEMVMKCMSEGFSQEKVEAYLKVAGF